jgi:hypothetical protein
MILGQEYYTFLFPLGLLLSSALLFPEDWAVLIVHLIVFRLPAVSIVRQMRQLLRDLAQAQKQSRILDLSDGT